MNTRELSQILMNIPGIGRERSKKIINLHREGMELLPLIKQLYPFLAVKKKHIEKARADAEILFESAERQNIKICCFNERQYPVSLLSLPDFPPLIYMKGESVILNRPLGAALIGSRHVSSFILKLTEIIGEILVYNGFTIISGLAIGCDTAAHMTALKNHRDTVAIMPCGPDVIYPRENLFLYQQIIEQKGLIFSEYEPGTEPAPFRFVQRDRLQSGLSRIVVLMEAGIHGGAMHAVFSALRQNIPVLVYAPGEFSESGSGNKHLLENEKVIPFSCPEDFVLIMKNIPVILSDCNRESDQLLFPYV